MKKVYLKKGCDKKIKKGYLWIFSNEVEDIKDFIKGEIVGIYNNKETFCAIGYINPYSLIAIRILSFEYKDIDLDFFINKIKTALELRNKFYNKPYYRLVYGESDSLPGLIIDRFDNSFVLQTNTYGMELLKKYIEQALIEIFGQVNMIYKNDSDSRKLEDLELTVECRPENYDGTIDIIENNLKMRINALSGQKTGYFYDQRNNRLLLSHLSKDKYVVDTFCYIGSFGLNALRGGAARVDFVDSSTFATNAVKENLVLNNFNLNKCNFINEDVLAFLKKAKDSELKADILIIDPPAFVKSKKLLAEGLKGYINLNKWAFLATKNSSLIFTFSCSYHINQELFKYIIERAALAAKKRYTIITELQQAFDHPVHPQMLETKYLKGYIVYINGY